MLTVGLSVARTGKDSKTTEREFLVVLSDE